LAILTACIVMIEVFLTLDWSLFITFDLLCITREVYAGVVVVDNQKMGWVNPSHQECLGTECLDPKRATASVVHKDIFIIACLIKVYRAKPAAVLVHPI